MEKPSLLILAAGMGSRYGGLKQIDPVGDRGEIILDFSIYDALRSGFGKIIFVIRKEIEAPFRERISARWEKRADIEYVFQDINMLPEPYKCPAGRSKPWGTGHAILCAANAIKGSFAAINADDFYGRDGFQLIADFLSNSAAPNEHCMAGFKLSRTLSENGSVSRGICEVTADSYLSGIEECGGIAAKNGIISNTERTFTGNETVSMNMWGFKNSIFDELKMQFPEFLKNRISEEKSEFYIPSALFTAIKAKRAAARVLASDGTWFGVTYREDKEKVKAGIRSLIDSGQYPETI